MSDLEITETDGRYEIDVKRFYAPFVISGPCPHCGVHTVMDFTKDYMNYPELNREFKVQMYHKQDGHCQGFTIMVKLGLTLEIVE